MRAIINGTQINIRNFEREPELEAFNAVVEALRASKEIKDIEEKTGIGEIYVNAKCRNDEVLLMFDEGFGFMPILCKEGNIKVVYDIVKKALDNMRY